MTDIITFVAGDDTTLTITAKDKDGVVVDLSGATIVWGVKKRLDNASTEFTKSTGSGITITDATNGVFVVSIDAADTTNLSGYYFHESKITDVTSKVSRLRDIDTEPGKIEFKKKILP